MPALGDYLGQLLAEVTRARLQADLESLRIAQLYAGQPLLQHLPVPRFRLPNVSLDLPVAIETTQSPPDTVAQPTVDLATLRKNVDSIIEEELKTRQIQLAPSALTGLTNNLNALFEQLKSSGTSLTSLTQTSQRAVGLAVEAIRTTAATATLIPAIQSALTQRFGVEFLRLLTPLPRVQVLVITAQLKELGPSQHLTQIHLSITEEGVEWTQTNPSDTSSKALLPE